MTMDTEYLKVGQIIYGAQRLDWAITSLIEWLQTERARQPNETTKVNLECARIRDEVTKLVNASSALGDTSPLDGYLLSIHDLHLALAQIIEDVGYSGVPPGLLRDHAKRLDLG